MSVVSPVIGVNHRFCVAPMLDWTDRHQRMLMRCITRQALLYTEMITPSALARDPHRHLRHHPEEHPLAIQLGGSDPDEMAEAARLAEAWGYDEVNLNLGCPSPRVGAGRFGAILMKESDQAAAVVRAMVQATSLPVTVKLRTGVDERDSFQELLDLVDRLAEAGAKTFIVHARKAWLQGLSPKENREIPPLQYHRVSRLKTLRPELKVILNGGLEHLEDCVAWLESFDGVMVGRAAYQHPYRWLKVDPVLFGRPAPSPDPETVVYRYLPYLEHELSAGTPFSALVRHLLPLFNGRPGARRWRRRLSEQLSRPGAGAQGILDALELFSA